MSESLAVGAISGHRRVAASGPRRTLQLALAVLWLLDGILQYQPFMFTRGFPQLLAASAAGSPAAVASPVNWSAALVTHHLVAANALFATIQLALGLGIAWRPAVKLALGASVAWALAVWWLGEGLGGILAGSASPLNGAPGAVILYALLAVLLWPADRDPAAPFVAGRAVGRRVARGLWLVLWASLAVLALQPAARAPGAISRMFSDLAASQPASQPGWLAGIGQHAASALAGRGLTASIVLAAALLVVAAGPFLPPPMAQMALVLAIALAAVIWLAEGLGALFTGAGTDPSSGPLLALLALTFWPAAPGPAVAPEGA